MKALIVSILIVVIVGATGSSLAGVAPAGRVKEPLVDLEHLVLLPDRASCGYTQIWMSEPEHLWELRLPFHASERAYHELKLDIVDVSVDDRKTVVWSGWSGRPVRDAWMVLVPKRLFGGGWYELQVAGRLNGPDLDHLATYHVRIHLASEPVLNVTDVPCGGN